MSTFFYPAWFIDTFVLVLLLLSEVHTFFLRSKNKIFRSKGKCLFSDKFIFYWDLRFMNIPTFDWDSVISWKKPALFNQTIAKGSSSSHYFSNYWFKVAMGKHKKMDTMTFPYSGPGFFQVGWVINLLINACKAPPTDNLSSLFAHSCLTYCGATLTVWIDENIYEAAKIYTGSPPLVRIFSTQGVVLTEESY